METWLHSKARVVARHSSGLLAIDKGAGVRSHPNDAKPDSRAILFLSYDQARECFLSKDAEYHLLHRLDAPTSGLVLLAGEAALAAAVKDAFARHEVQKTYYALVRGRPARSRETWHDRLAVVRSGDSVRAVTGRGDPAETLVELVDVLPGPPLLSLLRLQPVTGRTHQLRVQCAKRHLPIVGDATYGDFRFNRTYAKQTGEKRLFLHAAVLRVSLPGKTAPVFNPEAPLPSAFPCFD